MEFSEKIAALANRSRHAAQHALTEEATKTSVVLPLIQALGFDVFNLEEVVPEVVADVGIKKGEKIDFAIKINHKICILIEVKPITMSLGAAQYSQLFRYFGTTDARLAILTNGREVWFFSDVDEPNKMDKKPFFIFDLQSYDDNQVVDLARFQKAGFDVEKILEAASNLKYVKAVAMEITRQLEQPDDEFVKFFARQLHEGSVTKAVTEQFRPAVRQALEEVIRLRIQDRLNVTFGKDAVQEVEKPIAEPILVTPEVHTTPEEQMAFFIVQAIGSRLVPTDRITIRDSKSYCAVFVDDNNRKPICRFYFNAKSVKSIGIFDEAKQEAKHQIGAVSDLYKYSDSISKAIAVYA